MRAHLLTILRYVWAAFGVYWVAAALRRKTPTADVAPHAGEGYGVRFFRLPVLATTFALLFWHRLSVGFLGRRLVPDLAILAYSGFVITLAGLAVTVWARVHLGQQWSDRVVVRADHELIRTGPYARMRHPIYSGVLLGIAGTVLVVGEWRGAIAFLLLLTNYSVKARKEDRVLAYHFRDAFVRHAQEAGFLLPKFRGRP